jgi:GntR family transcriptional regulator, transcriptional repressor for pyruvate dehydrogenase complex
MDEQILPPLTRGTLAEQVYQVLVRYILRTGAEAGSRLPSERRFSEMLEVSRTVVRDALDQLAAEGYVEKRVGSGMLLVRRPPAIEPENGLPFNDLPATLEDLYQARIALEVGAMEWVVQGLTELDLARLAALADEMQERIASGDPILLADREFHNILIRACSNPVIIQFASIIDQYFEQMRTYRPDLVIDGWRLDLLDVRHRMIVMALRSRDTEAARQALRLHFLPIPKAGK